MKPIIKWSGGKGRLINKIKPYFSNFTYYIEPFFGGGAIFFELLPKKAIISDINPNLINLYLIVKEHNEKFIKNLERYETKYLSYENEDRTKFYYKIREKYNKIKYYDRKIENKDLKTRIKCSILFMFLNKTCFNGLYRENNSGGYNVPHGKYKNPTILAKELLIKISKYLNDNDIKIFCQNYKDTITYVDNNIDENVDKLIYLDPPYYPCETSKFTKYTKDIFEKNEHKELFETFEKINYPAYLSNSHCDDILEIYQNYTIYELDVFRSISSKKSTRGIVKELLIYNNK